MNEFLRADYESWLNSQPRLTKEQYIEKFLEMYDNSNWVYEQMLPDLDILKKENPEEYTQQILLIKQGYYSRESMRKDLEERLLKEDGLIVKNLYDGAVEHERLLKLQPWLNTKVKVINGAELKPVNMPNVIMRKRRK